MHPTNSCPAPAIRKLGVRRFLALITAAFATTAFYAEAQAPLDVRIALVIGNSAYAGAPLVNPANDARAMGDTLRGLGFTVVELRDAQKAQMTEAILKVRTSLQGKQGIGMLYYAGHGLQLDWQNYMVPVDAKLASAADVPVQTVNINSVIDAFKGAGNRMNILVLDACRDNPFAGTASGKGLAQLDAPPGPSSPTPRRRAMWRKTVTPRAATGCTRSICSRS
jgi:Caspase domain